MTDVRLYAGTIKRPDASYMLRPRALPIPPPPWVKFLPNGDPYPNVVIEVAVNHESPPKLKEDCHRYFRSTTSVCVWIGIQVWVPGRKFWVAWAERSATGNRGAIHTNMRLPPHHHSINVPVNLIYHIPMATVYGNGIAIPPNSPATLDVDCDGIRGTIVRCIFPSDLSGDFFFFFRVSQNYLFSPNQNHHLPNELPSFSDR
jgi:hypothetical protein